MSNDPLVSIVMPSYNQAEFIGRSIDNVFAQSHRPLELIVCDGGSNDGSQDILAEKAARYPTLRWTSEPDNGPASAINKALSQVRGTIIGWLNSDDLYTEGAIARAVACFSEHQGTLLCYGEAQHIDAEDAVIETYPTRPPEAGLDGFRNGCFICQPTMFFKTSVRTLLGPLDETLKTSFDYDYWLRAFTAFPERIGYMPEVQAQSRLHDACITVNMRRTVALEGLMLSHKFLGQGELHWLATYLEQVRAEQSGEAFQAELISVLAAAKPYLSAAQVQHLGSLST